ncbi:MAG TPA: hypothetical protein VFB87_08775, partial [Gaiellaceae bacterium]|nr:hypothetical protein [Gaiellaceae bacterium]
MARKSLMRITAGAALVAALTVFVASAAAGRLTIFAAAGLATPTAVAPANGLVVEALPAFSWAAVAKADKYEFQLAADAGMNSPVLGRGDDQFTTRNTRATLKKTIPNGTYWWRVRALQTTGTPSPWTAPRSVVKSWTSAPALQSPANGQRMTTQTVVLTAGASTPQFATGVPLQYQFEVKNAAGTVVAQAVVAQPTWTVTPDLAFNATHTWRVRAVYLNESGPWSNTM